MPTDPPLPFREVVLSPSKPRKPALKLFEFNPVTQYSGGCVIVAAANATKAVLLAQKDPAFDNLGAPTKLAGVYATGKPRIVVSATYIE